jgi:hypothetical protein
MTEQPFEPISEEEFLGNRRPEPPAVFPEPRTDLLMEAEVSAQHGVKSLENGELDAGIAWLQSALAFAQNARHVRETEAKVIDLSPVTFKRGQLEEWK